MDFSWTPEQLELKKKTQEFANVHLNSDLEKNDADSVFSQLKWKQCAEFGIQGMTIPTAYGGQEKDLLTSILAMEGLGYGCRDNGLSFALNAQMVIQWPIIHCGTPSQRSQYLQSLSQGQKLGAFAFTEPKSGSDLFSLSTTASQTDTGFIINGSKKLITFAPIADFFITFTTTNPNKGKWGLTAFLIEKDRPGITIGETQEKMGLRTCPIGEIEFENCHIPHSCLIGKVGAGLGILNGSLEWERCCVLATQVGAMERQLDDCVAFAKKREQFGQAIGKFQSISNRIVEMKLRLETARLLLYRVAWAKQEGESALMEAALAKLHLGEAFVQSSLDAIRIHGGDGYLSATGIERDLRDAIGGSIYGGTSDIQRNTIAGLLGL